MLILVYTVSMIKYDKKIILLASIILISLSAKSQQYEFSHLRSTDGLSNNQVESIFKDSRGYLWIGTNMGLNRYDGINFKVYKNIRNDDRSPLYDRIIGMSEDCGGNLWIKGESYIIYDWRKESFINNMDSVLNEMGLPPNPTVIEIDQKKNFFIAYEGKGIYKYDIHTGEITVYGQSGNQNGQDLSNIADIKTTGGFVWVLYENGVLERMDTETKSIDMRNTFFRENSQNATIKKTMFIDADSAVWIYPGVDDKGTAFFDPHLDTWILLDTKSNVALSSSFVRCVRQDKSGLIWIGTDHGGLNIFDKKGNSIEVIKNDINNYNSIGQNSIISLYCEDNGTIWVGTYKNGLSYYHPDMFKFRKPPLLYPSGREAEVFDCNSLCKDKAGNLWIGTNGKGLIKYNPQKNEIHRFRHDPQNPLSISSDIITSIFQDHRGVIWVGTFLGGLNAYDGKRFKRYSMEENNPNSLSSKSIYGLAEDNERNLWIATLGGGMNMLDARRETFTRYNVQNSRLVSDFILSIHADSRKNIYLSSDRGINFIDRDSKEIGFPFPSPDYIDSLTSISVNYQIADSRGLLWIATDKGINIYDPFTKRFSYLTSNDGLPGDEVVSLAEDSDGNIWAGTRSGLACIYCKYDHHTLHSSIVFFDENDGLPGSVCNLNAIFKDGNDTIYIGTTGGYVSFNPRTISLNRTVPAPRFTELLITNQVVSPDRKHNGRVIISKSISDLKEINLKHDETNFTVRFSSLDFIRPKKNRYRYMLEGIDNQWTEITDGVGAASYSNLNPGTYKLVVYAGNNNTWSDDPIELKINVAPPFWFSWWAYILYACFILVMIRLFLTYNLNKQKVKYEQAQKILEARKLHEVDELKLKFFTNISHEFKTPITLIISPLEKIMKSPVYEEHKSTFDIMYRNASNLLKMVNEILEFRKLDLNKMALNKSRGNIVEFIKEICRSFSSLASEKSIKLTFTTYLQEFQMMFDPEKMNKIIVNLLSNAFKYTEEGYIDISLAITEHLQNDHNTARFLVLKVIDTGVGIDPEYKDKIFERFFRIEDTDKNQQPGTGIGLHLVSEYVKLHGGEISVESTPGKGSVFTVLLPVENPACEGLPGRDILYPEETASAETASHTKSDIKSIRRANLPLLLIIDDNEDFCDFITDLFVEDYRIITTNDGEEGYTIVLDQLPDIILCDVMMPKMDGYEFCRKAKEDIRTSHIPIILLTAKSSEENKYSGIEAGADDYISKPFNIDILKLKIAKIIEKQKNLQHNFKKKIVVSPGDIEITSMDEKFVQKAISIVEKNIGNAGFLVEDLCKEMGMSRVYFYKKILALTDKTPSEFIRLIRLKRAVHLLEKSQKFVNEIAFEVGFNDPKYFRKYFREEFGLTPNEYKKAYQNNAKKHIDLS